MMQYRVVFTKQRGSWRTLWRPKRVRMWCAYELNDEGAVSVACFTPFDPRPAKEGN